MGILAAIAVLVVPQAIGRVFVPEEVPSGWVAEGGMPVARAVLKRGQAVSLAMDGAAVQAEPLILWPDGSVRWLFLRVRVTEPGTRLRGGVGVVVGKDQDPPLFPDGAKPPQAAMAVTAADSHVMRVTASAPVRGRWSSWFASGDLAHALSTDRPLIRWDVFWRRMDNEVWVGEVTLRNDPVHNPPGRLLLGGARLLLPDGWHGAVAWQQDNGLAKREQMGPIIPLLADGGAYLLGDGQTKTWRVWAGRREPAVRDRQLLENPLTLLPTGLLSKTGALGSFAPDPADASNGTPQVVRRLRQTWTSGWNGAWGDVRNTHTTGSPRNGLFDEALLRWAQTGDAAFLSVALPTGYQHALRPLLRDLDADAVPRAFLAEGLPHHGSRDKLGRDRLDPALEPLRGPEPEGWLAEWNGWTGYDLEHCTVDRLWGLLALTGSPWMAREIRAVGESLRTWPFARDERAPGSVRGCGWALRTLAHCASLPDGGAYVTAMGRLVGHMDGLERRHGKGWLNDQKGNARQLADHRFTVPWQHAVVLYGLSDATEWLPGDDRVERMAGVFADFLVEQCWDEKGGRFYKSLATDGSGVILEEPALRGTNCWIPPALVLADRMLPDRGYLEAARRGWEPVRAELVDWVKSRKQWHFIQPCLTAFEKAK